jgi:SAM-dependent methyltransferase
MTGIDSSEGMLRFAREKVPAGDFFLLDARAFDFPPRFQAALSTFDSLNHVIALEELAAVFQNVRRALSDGGLFLFDLNLEEAYLREWSKQSAIVEEDHACIVRGGYDPATRIGRAEITMFRREEGWRRSDATLFQKSHAPEEVESALAQAGFGAIRRYDAGTGLGMAGEIGVGRAFFLAVKPGGSGLE